MAFLLIFRADKGAFVESEALEKLGSVGVRDLQRNSMFGAAIAGHFHWSGDEVLIELKSGACRHLLCLIRARRVSSSLCDFKLSSMTC